MWQQRHALPREAGTRHAPRPGSGGRGATHLAPDRNSFMMDSRSFCGMSPCMDDTVKLASRIFSVSQSTCRPDRQTPREPACTAGVRGSVWPPQRPHARRAWSPAPHSGRPPSTEPRSAGGAEPASAHLPLGVAEDDRLGDGQRVVEIAQRVELPLFPLHCHEKLLDALQSQLVTGGQRQSLSPPLPRRELDPDRAPVLPFPQSHRPPQLWVRGDASHRPDHSNPLPLNGTLISLSHHRRTLAASFTACNAGSKGSVHTTSRLLRTESRGFRVPERGTAHSPLHQDADGVRHELVGHLQDLVRQRGADEHHLRGGRQVPVHVVDLLLEAWGGGGAWPVRLRVTRSRPSQSLSSPAPRKLQGSRPHPRALEAPLRVAPLERRHWRPSWFRLPLPVRTYIPSSRSAEF